MKQTHKELSSQRKNMVERKSFINYLKSDAFLKYLD